ncbi:MAG: ribosome maturation factor RimM [Pseudomonadota bacterium]
MDEREELVCVGAVAGAYGVQGAVRLKSFCAEPEAIGAYGPLQTEAGARFSVTLSGPIAGGLSARLSGVATREAAQALKGTRLYVPRSRLPSLPEDEFYHADLIGLIVQDSGGQVIGRVRAIADHGAGDVMEIAGPPLRTPLLLPFTRAFVPSVDLAAGRVVVDLSHEDPSGAEDPPA